MRSDKKILIFSFIVLIIIFCTGFLIKSYLEKSTLKLNENINTIEDCITSGNWDKADKEVKNLKKDWDKLENTWSLFINHHEIDNISISLENASEYIKYKDEEFTSAYLSALKRYIDHIPDMEKLSLKNIL